MLRYLILCFVCFVGVLAGSARSFVQNLEAELWDGLCIPTNMPAGTSPKIEMSSGVSFRYCFENKPWAVGHFIQNETHSYIDKISKDAFSASIASFGLMTEYRRKIEPGIFAFMSMGVAAEKIYGDQLDKWSYGLMPKIGMELDFMRVSFYYHMSRERFDTFGLILGLNIGSEK